MLSAFLAGRVSTRMDLSGILPNVVPNVVPDEKPPVPGDGKHLAIIYETQDRASMPRGQQEIIDSVTIRKMLIDGGWTARYLDDDTEFTTESQWFRAAVELPMDSLPWVVLSNGKAGYSGPLPQTAREFTELVDKYGD
jgi:hypothetical protein